MRYGAIIGIFIVLGIAAIIFIMSKSPATATTPATFSSPSPRQDATAPPSPIQEKTNTPIPSTPSLADTLASNGILTIGGSTITQAEVDQAYRELPPETTTPKESVAESLITEKILIQQAKKKGISITDAEVSSLISQLQTKSSLNDQEFQQAIAEHGETLTTYRTKVHDALAVSKLLNQELDLLHVQATDAEVTAYIESNKEQFIEFFEEQDPEVLTILQEKVQQQLTQKKKQDLITSYIQKLTAETN